MNTAQCVVKKKKKKETKEESSLKNRERGNGP
jgi:hypothetical protein